MCFSLFQIDIARGHDRRRRRRINGPRCSELHFIKRFCLSGWYTTFCHECYNRFDSDLHPVGADLCVRPLPGIENGQTQRSVPTSQTTTIQCKGLCVIYDTPDPLYGWWDVWGIMYKYISCFVKVIDASVQYMSPVACTEAAAIPRIIFP